MPTPRSRQLDVEIAANAIYYVPLNDKFSSINYFQNLHPILLYELNYEFVSMRS